MTTKHTQRIIKWLQSEIGKAALETTRHNSQNHSYAVILGYTLGKYGHQFATSYFDRIDFDEVALAIFGETDKKRIARENGSKGGKPRGETPSRATLFRDKAKERKAKEQDG